MTAGSYATQEVIEWFSDLIGLQGDDQNVSQNIIGDVKAKRKQNNSLG